MLLYVTSSVKGSDRETNTGGQDRAVNKYTTSLAIFGLHNPWDVDDNESKVMLGFLHTVIIMSVFLTIYIRHM